MAESERMRERRTLGATAAGAQVVKHQPFRANQRFEPLPAPVGAPPYRVDLSDIVGTQAANQPALAFHVVGDTGGVKYPVPQQIVALHLEQDAATAEPAPVLLYHLGDVVYYNGQRDEYFAQFYEPYAHYGPPVVAIPGNHDGDPLDATAEPSLAAFMENFCAPRHHVTPEAQDVDREAMTIPNPYWTLRARVFTVIGLYTNVPEGGRVDDEQVAWFEQELAEAPSDRAVIVALHHPPYSADAHHGGSARMGQVLDDAANAAGRFPDLVLTGHVHNYQRFTRSVHDRQIPYIVAGAGGYWHLHYMARDDGQQIKVPWDVPRSDVTLEAYCDDRHGFLRLTVTDDTISGAYVTVPRPQESWRNGPVAVADAFTLDLATHLVG